MEWVVSILGSFCIYLFIRCIQLDTQIRDTESRVREEFRDTFVSSVKDMTLMLYDHIHDPSTGYVDRVKLVEYVNKTYRNGKKVQDGEV